MTKCCTFEGGWPLVWASYVGSPELGEFEAHLAELLLHVRKHDSPFALLFESRLTDFGPALRKASVDFMKNNEDLNGSIVGVGTVLHSPFQRGLITALLWFYPAPYEFRVAATRPEAELWATELLAKRAGASAAPP